MTNPTPEESPMFYVMIKRVMRVTQPYSEADKFRPRSTNLTRWEPSGPYRTRSTAEKVALAANQTHTCLATRIYDEEELLTLAAYHGYQLPYRDDELHNTVIATAKGIRQFRDRAATAPDA